MSVLALTTSLFNAYDTAAIQAQQAAREAARAKSKAALSEVKPLEKSGSGSAHGASTHKAIEPAHDATSSLQVLRRAMDAHTIDVEA